MSKSWLTNRLENDRTKSENLEKSVCKENTMLEHAATNIKQIN